MMVLYAAMRESPISGIPVTECWLLAGEGLLRYARLLRALFRFAGCDRRASFTGDGP